MSQKQFLGEVSRLFTDAAKDGEALASRWNQVLSSSVSDYAKKHGLAQVETGIAAIDAIGGQASQSAKQGESDVASGYHDLLQSGSSAVSSAASFVGLSLADDGTSAINQAAKNLAKQARLEAALAPF